MPRTRKEDIFPNYVRVRNVDQTRLAELTISAKGSRSMNEFARLCGVNPSTLSRLVNQKNNGPCAETLIKAIADNADPDSDVTLDMLLDAYGLAPIVVRSSEEDIRFIAGVAHGQLQKILAASSGNKPKTSKAKLNDLTTQDTGIDQSLTSSKVLIQMADEDQDQKESSKLLKKAANKVNPVVFERDAQDIIVAGLVNQGWFVKREVSLEYSIRQQNSWICFDFGVSTDALKDRGIDQWYFEVKSGVYSTGTRFLNQLFGELYLNSLYNERKAVSLVIGDINVFRDIRQNYWNIYIDDYVSVILVDRANHRIADEFIFPQKGHERYKTVFDVIGVGDPDDEGTEPEEDPGE